jgi:hypothetical protein
VPALPWSTSASISAAATTRPGSALRVGGRAIMPALTACAGDWGGHVASFSARARGPLAQYVRRPHAPGLRSARCCAVPLRSVQISRGPEARHVRRLDHKHAAATGEPGQVGSVLGKGPSVAGARDRWSRCCFIISTTRCSAASCGVARSIVRSDSARPAGRPATATPSSRLSLSGLARRTPPYGTNGGANGPSCGSS